MSEKHTAMHWREPRQAPTTSVARQGMQSAQTIPMEREEQMTKGRWLGYEGVPVHLSFQMAQEVQCRRQCCETHAGQVVTSLSSTA